MSRLVRSIIALALVVRPGFSQAPESSRTSYVIGPLASGMTASGPQRDGILGLGLAAGIDRAFSRGLNVRAIATIVRGMSQADDISICYLDGSDGCLPDPLLPYWLATTEVTASMALIPQLPLRLHAGIGFAIAGDARRARRSASATHSGIETPRILRGGLEIPLGGGTKAPRLLLTRVWFDPKPFSLRRVDGVAILFPR